MSDEYQSYKTRFEAERIRLIQALGMVTEGGIVEAIEHIGATSVPGMYGSSCIDIGLAVWPFPIEADPKSKLAALDYEPVSGYEEGAEQRFQHRSESFKLYLVESGIPVWYDRLAMRDYLRNDETARQNVSLQKKEGLPESDMFARILPAAQQWWVERYGFIPVEAVAHELKQASFPWYISGGWALDLFLGRVSRMHYDVDVSIPYSSQMELRRLLRERHWKLVTPFEKRLEPWPPHMQLQLPRHQVHAYRDGTFIDFLLANMDGIWRYRREPVILRSMERMALRTDSGIPYLAPELALLFKSKNTSTDNRERPKDQLDFEKVLPHLEPERRAWLRWALIAVSPEHPWITQLV